MTKSAMDLVQEAKLTITEVTPEQASNMLNNTVALDVRELSEYQAGHLPSACHITRGMLEFMIENHPQFQDKNTSVIVYCSAGGRSALATAVLQQLGFTNVHSLKGGFDAWNEYGGISSGT